jgi:CRISPR/Cas system-associated exonuclease Cas4 (RecB family)
MKDATSFRVRKSSFYDKKSNTPFKISRSKFSNFLSCKRCFYLDRVIGLKEPSMPGWALNIAVDELLKKEFDQYRKEQKPHPIMLKHKLDYVPYQHKDLDIWRNSLKGGISYHDEKTNLILHGGIDDVWFDLQEKKLVVVDYKAQSSNYPVTISSYLGSEWHLSYKLQMDIYVHIMRKMNFEVSDTTYFYVCNGEKTNNKFEDKIDFKTTLVPYTVNTSWIEEKLYEMKEVLNLDEPPSIDPSCEKCAYLKGGKNYF